MNKDLSSGRVIISYGRSIMALVAAHSLGKRGVEVIGCDSVDLTILSFSNKVSDYFLYPDIDKDGEEAFVEGLLEKVKEFQPDDDRPYVLMPIFTDMEILSKHKDMFEPYIKIAAPDFDAISRLTPKNNFANTIKELGVDAPQTWMPESEDDLRDIVSNLDFPVIVKPYDQVGGRGIHKVDNEEQIIDVWNENQEKYNQNSLIQELANGRDYCMTAIFENGVRKASMAYRNVHQFPQEAGAGIMRETVDDSKFEKIVDDLMGPLKWNGIAEFDFMWDGEPDSTPAIIEVNTRFWAGLFQSVESGIDFPWLLYKLTVTGHIEEQSEAEIGTITKMPYVWLVSAMKDVLESDSDMGEIHKHAEAAVNKIKNGELLSGIKDYGVFITEYLGETFNFSKKADKFKETLELGRSAKNEFLSNDDPKTAFGVLFIVSALLKHGELPKEVKF